MSETSETIATQGETETVETVPQPATETDTGTETQTADQAAEPEPKPKQTPWFQRRIDELTREKHEARRREEAMAAQLRQIQQPNPQQQPPAGYVPASEVERVARQITEASAFNRECDSIADFGSSKFADFGEAVSNFQLLGGPPPALLEAVVALGQEEGARAFYELGKNPDEAARIINLSPARMAVEVAKIAAKPVRVVPVSKVPDPIRTIGSGAVRNGGEPDPNSEEWLSWFRKNQKR